MVKIVLEAVSKRVLLSFLQGPAAGSGGTGGQNISGQAVADHSRQSGEEAAPWGTRAFDGGAASARGGT